MAKLETRERIGRERGSAGINPNPPLISTLEHTTSGEPKHQKLSTKRKKESAAVDNYIHTKLAFATKCYNVSENVQFSARSYLAQWRSTEEEGSTAGWSRVRRSNFEAGATFAESSRLPELQMYCATEGHHSTRCNCSFSTSQ